MKKWNGILIALISIMIVSGALWASTNWRMYVTPYGGGFAVGDIPYADMKDRLTNISQPSAANAPLLSGGTGVAPKWGSLVLPNYSNIGSIPYGSANNTYANLASGAANTFLRSAGALTAPTWSTTILPNFANIGDIWYASANNTLVPLAAGSNGTILQTTGVAPSYVAKNIHRIASHTFSSSLFTWTLSADEATCYYLMPTVPSTMNTCMIYAPAVAGQTYAVINTAAGNSVQIRVSGQTGIGIATGKNAIVFNSGTDYARVTADQAQ